MALLTASLAPALGDPSVLFEQLPGLGESLAESKCVSHLDGEIIDAEAGDGFQVPAATIERIEWWGHWHRAEPNPISAFWVRMYGVGPEGGPWTLQYEARITDYEWEPYAPLARVYQFGADLISPIVVDEQMLFLSIQAEDRHDYYWKLHASDEGDGVEGWIRCASAAGACFSHDWAPFSESYSCPGLFSPDLAFRLLGTQFSTPTRSRSWASMKAVYR